MSLRHRNILIGAACVAVLAGGLLYEAVATRPVRRAVRAYFELISIANRPDLDDESRARAARPFFSDRLLADHPIQAAPEGGLVGLPRSISKNFQAWRQEGDVWICPTNRVGFVYRMTEDADGRWRYDGLVGLLQSRNVLVPISEAVE